MSFASFTYILFLPVVWGIYWMLSRRHSLQNLFLLIASYVFYGWMDWHIVPIFLCISLIAYSAGIAVHRYEGTKNRTAVFWTSTILIISNLAVFKYYNFFSENITRAFNSIGISCDLPTIHVILPIGISFYTFQALGYLIDVYCKRQTPTRDLIAFLTFISFFPQLVAGPIERAKDLLPQIEHDRRVDFPMLTSGSRLILWGLFKKLVIADNCAFAVNEIWAHYAEVSGLTLLTGAFLFSFQIYCDFSGYSDIAIGSAKLFGIRLSANFNYPYYASSIADFWRRWNMTLMSWFRDYIYIPLGGNRSSKAKKIRNTSLVFLISGLWHGANWTFVLWGAYHALLMIPRIMLKGLNISINFPRKLKVIFVFCLVTFGWILFRAPTITDAFTYISGLGFDGNLTHGKIALMYCLLFIIIEWIVKNKDIRIIKNLINYKAVRWSAYYLTAMAILLFKGQTQAFIYFQF